MRREPLLWCAAASLAIFAGRYGVRAVLGEPPPPAAAGDERAPGEPESPGLGPSDGAEPGGEGSDGAPRAGGEPPEAVETEAQESWERRYFPVPPFEPEVERAALIRGRAVPPAPRPAADTVLTPGEMVLIPAGEALLGDDALAGARPARRVLLPAYRIDRTEVTMAAYADYVRSARAAPPFAPDAWAAPYRFDGTEPPAGAGEHPVVLVTRDEARAYCEHVGKRLPTEDEWERAARGDAGARYPWGNRWDSLRTNVVTRLSGPLRSAEEWERFAETFAGDRRETLPVGSQPQDVSPFGVLDMAGNVSEWVEGTFHPVPGAPPGDHPAFGHAFAVARGNAWGNRDYSAPLAVRYPFEAGRRDIMLGFRCAADAPR